MKITQKQQPLKQRELKRPIQNGVHLHKNVSVIKEINIHFYFLLYIYSCIVFQLMSILTSSVTSD